METLNFPKCFFKIEIVPGNGYSPYTGYTVFRANMDDYSQRLAIKCGKYPKNNHISLQKEFDITNKFKHQQIIEFYQINKENSGDYIIMENLPYGGRRSRWRDIIKKWDYGQLHLFITQMFNIILWLDKQGWSHNDVEFANIGSRDENFMPVLFDFGKSKVTNSNPALVKANLSLDVKSGYNAWVRELFGIGGKYEEEGPMLDERWIKILRMRLDYEKLLNAHP